MISGSAKKQLLKTPRGVDVRPTADRVKEALFNILGGRVPGSVFLDLFAGTGNIGIEALSRGADKAVFVENKIKHVRVIKENLKTTGFESKARVLHLDVADALHLLKREELSFDIIFMDPPYSKGFETSTLAGIAAFGLLKQHGIIIVESRKDGLPSGEIDGLKMTRAERYGDTLLSFFSR
ncbi:MAG TPA: 16S rRNA (guanine(966)-N(2))-methyltransferase RsmD [Bacillota bacterium]|nr:16S rRNA (guanine(966)-N(2))-methyltransferase RsmD [Bacillota bacterium]